MADTDYHLTVGDALAILIDGLSPFVERVFGEILPPGADWTDLLRRKDIEAGRRVGLYRNHDLALMLRAMTERLGNLGFPFSRDLPRHVQNYAGELRDVRNRWAHNEPFTAAEAYRAVDTAELLLRAVGADQQAEQVKELKPAPAPRRHARPETTSAQPLAASAAPGRHEAQDTTTPETPETSETPETTPCIEIRAIPGLSYPMAHCQIPVIDHITIDNSGDELRGAVLELDVTSAGGSHGGPRQIHLDPAAMLTVDEPRPGAICATLRDAKGTEWARTNKNVTILAANQWKATPPQLALELLAAHVQPNSSAITTLLTQVSDRLQHITGNSAIDGYQSDNPERVDAIAQAIFEAMRAHDIRYAEPPASWGLDGQKVRIPAEVLDGRLASCLDTTLTMAAALDHQRLGIRDENTKHPRILPARTHTMRSSAAKSYQTS